MNAANFLKTIKVDAIKIASMDAVNYILISHCINLKIPIIISTGMCDSKDIRELNSFLQKYKTKKISILHCISNYPCKIIDSNLLAIKSLKKYLKIK